MPIANKVELVYPELSYKIVGVLFAVSNELGFGHRESTVQQAVSQALRNADISFIEQEPAELRIAGEVVKRYRLDFLIEHKLILELKSKERFDRQDVAQVYDYLKGHKLRLGILANFGRRGVKFKRILCKID